MGFTCILKTNIVLDGRYWDFNFLLYQADFLKKSKKIMARELLFVASNNLLVFLFFSKLLWRDVFLSIEYF